MNQTKKVLVALTLTSGFFVAPAALAADVPSKGYVDFKNEDEQLGGSLRIDRVSAINFGTVGLKGDTAVYSAIYTADETGTPGTFLPLNVQTTDNRGTNAGWQLQVKHSRQFSEIDAEGNLVPDGSILTNSTLEFTSTSAVDNAAISEVGKLGPSGFKSETVLNDSFKTVVNADEGEGVGSWKLLFGAVSDTASTESTPVHSDTVKLTVPGSTQKKENVNYEAELTWTLLATPEI